MALAQRLVVDRGIEEDLTPSRAFKIPQTESAPQEGRIQAHIEYQIDPERSAEFIALMQESRRSRLGQGALDWQVLQDLYNPGHIVEQITDEERALFDALLAATRG